MKILEITNTDFALRQFIWPLMQALRARGHEVVGVCGDGPALAVVRADGFRVETPNFARSYSPVAQAKALFELVRLIRRERPDLVHAHMPISGLLGRVAARLCGVKRIAYTGHGFLFNQPGSFSRRKLALTLEWLAGRITHTYLTVSTEEAAQARRLGIHRGAVGIGNGRDPARFRPDASKRARVRAELGVSADAVVIVAVARLVAHKGFRELLAAMDLVPGAELWVVGTRLASDHGPDLTADFEAARVRLGGRLRMLGARDNVAELLAASDVFTLPSHFEGLPMSIVEAMLSGLPVVATDISGPREQVVDGVTGFVVPPMQVAPLADALNRLVADPALRARMGAASLSRALETYVEADVIARTVALLEATKTPSPARP